MTEPTTMTTPTSKRWFVATLVSIITVAVGALVLFGGTAQSSGEPKRPVPVWGSNPGVRGEGGR